MLNTLYGTATNITGIQSITLIESYGQASNYAEIVCSGHAQTIGGACTVDFGYVGNHAVQLVGTVTEIKAQKPEFLYTITVHDAMYPTTVDYLAADDPNHPYTVDNVSGEQMVVDLLAHSGLTGLTYDATGFTFATNGPAPLNTLSVWDAIDNVCRIVGFICYADIAGALQFHRRWAYPNGGDASAHTFTTGDSGDIIHIARTTSAKELRNRVVVYGNSVSNIHATAQASSPYLPAGFYQSLVISHELITEQTQAQATADLNLALWNRLTDQVSLDVLGDPSYHVRNIYDINESFCGVTPGMLYFCHATRHTLDDKGYQVRLDLTR